MTIIKIIATISLFLAVSLYILSCGGTQDSRSTPTSSDVVIVKADTSLQLPLQELAAQYSFESSIKVRFEFVPSMEVLNTSSSDSVDIYLFSNDHLADSARSLGLIDTTATRVLAYAVPCLLVPRLNPNVISNLTDLKKNGLRIGIPDPNEDVLGAFALELVKNNNLFDPLQPHLLIKGKSAREVANLISMNEIDVSIGWAHSLNWNPETFDVILLLPEEIPRVAIISTIQAAKPAHPTNSGRFMTYLKTDRCQDIFRKWGYLINPSDLESYAPNSAVGGRPIY